MMQRTAPRGSAPERLLIRAPRHLTSSAAACREASAPERRHGCGLACHIARRCRRQARSRMTAMVSRSWLSTVVPTLPRTPMIRCGETARMCWHCAADTTSRPLLLSGSSTTSEWNERMLLVSGTTWTTEGWASRIRWAVTMIAGWRNPASRPSGGPSSRSTTSPGVGIEPGSLVLTKGCREVGADAVLAKGANCKGHGVTDRGVELRGKSLELFVCRYIDANAGALHADQHTSWEMPSDVAGSASGAGSCM